MKNKKYYHYGMRLRPFGIGCQPKDGFVGRTDDFNVFFESERYWDILIYDRELTEKEMLDYDLDYLGES